MNSDSAPAVNIEKNGLIMYTLPLIYRRVLNYQIKDIVSEPQIAYFSMEIGFRNDIPTYSGGLGVLAGDTIKSAADLNLPMVAVTLIYRKDTSGSPLTRMDARASTRRSGIRPTT